MHICWLWNNFVEYSKQNFINKIMVDKDEVREQIVEAARQVFAKFGFRKTTMDEIAYALRKGKSSIYYYFEGKEEIYQAVIEKEASILKKTIEDSLAKQTNPVEKLRLYIITRMDTIQKMVNFYEAIKNEWLSNMDFVNKIRVKYDNDEIQILKSIFDEGQKAGVFRINDTYITSIAVVTTLKGLETPLFLNNEENYYEERIQQLVNLLFYGILKQ